MAPMKTRPIAAADVATRTARACAVSLPDGRTALASRHTLTPPYSAARGELVDRAGEHQVKEELDPARAAPLEAVPGRRPQRRRADPQGRYVRQVCLGALMADRGVGGGHGRSPWSA